MGCLLEQMSWCMHFNSHAYWDMLHSKYTLIKPAG